MLFQKGHKPAWTEASRKKLSVTNTGRKLSAATRKKISESTTDEKHPQWKSDRVGYLALHQWIARKLGSPRMCAHCKTTTAKRYDWANVSKQYVRDLSDWIRLCRKCHC